MDSQFWHEQWENKQIGFHQSSVHALLSQFWSLLGLETGQVFVPLCGKSLDMVWLHQRGHSILGIELSHLAVTDFFKEQALQVSTRAADGFQWFESDGYQLLCGDYFHLEPRHLAKVEAVYDRAALIAMPPHLQTRYAEHLLQLLPHRPPILVITFEYDPDEMVGPPFPVSDLRINELFGHVYSVETLAVVDALELQPGLRSRGLSRLVEKIHYLRVINGN